MEEKRQELNILIDSIDNPKILENLVVIIRDYVLFYSIEKQTSVED